MYPRSIGQRITLCLGVFVVRFPEPSQTSRSDVGATRVPRRGTMRIAVGEAHGPGSDARMTSGPEGAEHGAARILLNPSRVLRIPMDLSGGAALGYSP